MTIEETRPPILFSFARPKLAVSVQDGGTSTSITERTRYVAVVLFLTSCVLCSHATSQTAATKDLSGFWQTGSGAVYQVFQKGPYVLAIYLKPSQGQLDSGIKSGDIAYEGNLLGGFASGQFHHRFPLVDRSRCPANWYRITAFTLTIKDSGDTMEGDLLDEHQADDNCEMDDQRIDHLVFKRIPKPAGFTEGSQQTPATKSQTGTWATSG